MSDNPYESPAAESPATRRRVRIRLLPAAICFMIGAVYTISGSICLAFGLMYTLFGYKPVSLASIAGYAVFVLAGVIWVIAGRGWNRGTWIRAIVLSVAGYLGGFAAAHLCGFTGS